MGAGIDYVREFQRAAAKRREAARILFGHNPPHFTDAVYLAGYTAECMLKALILNSVPRRTHVDVIGTNFRGQRGHNLTVLWDHVCQLGINAPPGIRVASRHLSTWTTDLRYETSEFDADEAKRFLSDVDLLTNWVKERLK